MTFRIASTVPSTSDPHSSRRAASSSFDPAPRGGVQAVGVAVEVLLGALAFGDVVSDLGEAARFSGLVEQRREDDVRPELRPVLAYAPALAFVSSLDRGEL